MAHVDLKWDESWRPLTRGAVRHLLVLLRHDATDTSGTISVAIRFWGDDYQLVSVAITNDPSVAPRRVDCETRKEFRVSVPITAQAPTIMVVTLAVMARLGLHEGVQSIGELLVAAPGTETHRAKRIALQFFQGLVSNRSSDFAALAMGARAELLRTDLTEADLARLSDDLRRCAEAAGLADAQLKPGVAAALTELAAACCEALWKATTPDSGPTASDVGNLYHAGPAGPSGSATPEASNETTQADVAIPRLKDQTPAAARVPAGLPTAIANEWSRLVGSYDAKCDIQNDVAVVDAIVAGLPVRARVSVREFPVRPPTLFVLREIRHSLVGPDGRISNLPSLRNWNRTFGLAHVLNELENEWRRRRPTSFTKDASILTRLRARLFGSSMS